MGLFSKMLRKDTKPKKSSNPKVVRNGDWEVYIKDDGTPTGFYKKGKEWFDPDLTWSSPNRKYFLQTGWDGAGNAGLALTTQTEVLKIKRADDAALAIVTDDGVAYAMNDCGILYIITAEKASQRTLRQDDNDPDQIILTPQVAAIAYDDWDGNITIKGIEINTGKAWKKIIPYTSTGDEDGAETSLEQIERGLKLTTPDGTEHLFTTAGAPLT